MPTVMTSNGSGKIASLTKLLDMLDSEPLDPRFERFGNFILPLDDKIQFFGNFLNVSHVFNVTTDEPKVYERLSRAIRNNQDMAAYQSAKLELRSKRFAA